MIRPSSPLTMLLSRHTRRRAFISLFGVLAAASSLAAHAQESGTMRPTGTLPQIEVARVKPVDRSPPNLRLIHHLIDLMKDFSLSNAQAIGGAWGIPLRPSTPFHDRAGHWRHHYAPRRRRRTRPSTSRRPDPATEYARLTHT